MTQQQWEHYLLLLAQAEEQPTTHCVSCWYEQHKEVFPYQDSSSLCPAHAQMIRANYINARQEARLCTA